MHYKSWKHTSKIHFPHVLPITMKALAQPVSGARVSVRYTFLSRVAQERKTY